MFSWSTAMEGGALRSALALPVLAALAAAAPASADAASVHPTVRAHENTVCADIKPSRKELKVDPPLQGTHAFDDGTLRGTYTVTGDTLAWTSETVSVDYVLVKGGADTNVYTYGSSHGDTGLVAPDNASGGPAGLSHFTLCYDNQNRGRLHIVKRTTPGGSAERFAFYPSAGLESAGFELADGETMTLRPKPGTHTVEEAQKAGWRVDRITCDDADSTGSGRKATIVVDPGEELTCTFYNEKEPDVVAPPAPQPPAPAPPVPDVVDVTPLAPAAVPVAATAAPAPAPAPAAAAPAASDVRGRTIASGRAALRSTACASRVVRVAVAGSPIRRIVFSVDGRQVRTVTVPAGRRALRVTLPSGGRAVTRVSARVTFRNGARSRTLQTTVVRCAVRQVRPQFTG